MPIRGERVGQAYVRILADGSEVPKGIRDSLDEADKDVRRKGSEHGEAYEEEFAKRVSQKDIGKGIREALEKSFARADVADAYFGSRDWQRFTGRIKAEFGEAGSLAVTSLQDEFSRRGSLSGLDDAISHITERVARSADDLRKMEDAYARDHAAAVAENNRRDLNARLEMLSEAYKMDAKFTKDRAEQEENFRAQAERMNRAYDKRELAEKRTKEKALQDLIRETDQLAKNISKDAQKRLREATASTRALDREIAAEQRKQIQEVSAEYRLLVDDLGKIEAGQKGVSRTTRALRRDFERIRTELTGLDPERGDTLSAEFKRVNDRLIVLHPRLTRMNALFDKSAEAIGRMSGKGSRNNFVNFIGSAASGVTRLVTLIPRLVTSLGSQAYDAFQKAGGGASGLAAGAISIGTSFAAAAAVVGVAATAMVVFLGPLVALMSGLLGIVAALASTLSFSLVAGLVAATAVLAPLIAGIGVAVFAIKSMSDEMKGELKRATKGLREDFKDLGEDAARVLTKDMIENAEKLEPVLALLRRPVLRLTRAVGDVGTGWVNATNSPGFKRFVEQIDGFLPGAVRSLGRIVRRTIGGIGGIFIGAIPSMERFLGWLEDITEKFSDWANSVEGQEEIVDFFDRAADSAESLGGFLDEVWDLLVLIIDKGQGTGDSIFDRMGNSIEKFTKYLEENPDALADWFEHAEDTAVALGDLAVAIGEVFDALDSEESRNAILDVINLFQWFLENGPLVPVLNAIADGIQGIADAIDDVSNGEMPDFSGFVSAGLRAPIKIATAFKGLPSLILKNIGPIQLLKNFNIPTLGSLAVRFAGGAGRILRSIGTVNLFSIFRFPTLTSIASRFSGLAQRVLSMVGTINLGGLVRVPSIGDIASRFAGLASAILRAVGTIDFGSLFRFPPKGGGVPYVPGVATGGMFGRITNGPVLRWVGEDGPEAIVPLARNLGEVDPAVRGLSAIAQGKSTTVNGDTGKKVDASGWTIQSYGTDPVTVAREVGAYLTAAAF